ncbi:MAG: hypothetical protein CMQ30_07105, partial [Gammaproteobacteria bacterium]|nr:hypothetical protein [Gammaproteobacteria bacterium]
MIAGFKKNTFFNSLIWFAASVLIILTILELPIGDMLPRIRAISISVWTTLLLVNLIILFLAVKRWQILSQIFGIEISFARLFIIRQAGSTFSFVTPGPQFGGEPLQAYWLNRGQGIPIDNTIASIGADRFIEVFINFSLLFLGILLVIRGNIEADLSNAVFFVSLSLISLLTLLSLLLYKHRFIISTLFSLYGLVFRKASDKDQEQRIITSISMIFSRIEKEKLRVTFAIVIGVFGWFALIFELYLMMSALNLTPDLYEIALVMIGIRIALLMPIPGGVGTMETSLIWSFGVLGLSMVGAGGVIALNRIRDLIILALGAGCLLYLSRRNLIQRNVS